MSYYSTFELEWKNQPEWFSIEDVIDALLEVSVYIDYKPRDMDFSKSESDYATAGMSVFARQSEGELVFDIVVDSPFALTRRQMLNLAWYIESKMAYTEHEAKARRTWRNILTGAEREKWQQVEDDMKVVSKKFPEVYFTMHIDGEHSDDFRKMYFLNGKSEVIKAEIVFAKPTLVA